MKIIRCTVNKLILGILKMDEPMRIIYLNHKLNLKLLVERSKGMNRWAIVFKQLLTHLGRVSQWQKWMCFNLEHLLSQHCAENLMEKSKSQEWFQDLAAHKCSGFSPDPKDVRISGWICHSNLLQVYVSGKILRRWWGYWENKEELVWKGGWWLSYIWRVVLSIFLLYDSMAQRSPTAPHCQDN